MVKYPNSTARRDDVIRTEGYRSNDRGQLACRVHRAGRYAGELLAIIDPENLASQNVCRKLGFTYWKQAPIEGYIANLYTLFREKPPRKSRSDRSCWSIWLV